MPLEISCLERFDPFSLHSQMTRPVYLKTQVKVHLLWKAVSYLLFAISLSLEQSSFWPSCPGALGSPAQGEPLFLPRRGQHNAASSPSQGGAHPPPPPAQGAWASAPITLWGKSQQSGETKPNNELSPSICPKSSRLWGAHRSRFRSGLLQLKKKVFNLRT